MSKCMVLLSGGQDSATCLAMAVKEHDEVHTVSINYGQRHVIELEKAMVLSDEAGAKSHDVIFTDIFKQLGHSALIENGNINDSHELSDNLPASFVPGRNYIFLGLVAVKAFQKKINTIYTGVCQTDYSGYPDCREPTIRHIEKALSAALDWPIYIQTPLMFLTKAQTVELMQRLNMLHLYKFTHTCYEGDVPPCGKCPSCILRAKGFEEAGIADPLLEVN